jgi:GR25 family glycosyltransferase involved in LPS biosynthesis
MKNIQFFIILILVISFFLYIYFNYFVLETFDTNYLFTLDESKENNEFDNIEMYVITLRHMDRMQNIELQQAKIPEKEIILFDAVKGDFIDEDQLVKEGILDPAFIGGTLFRKREIACYMSHLNVYKKIKENKNPGYTILFEDDFIIETEHFLKDVYKIINTLEILNKDFDLIYLGQVTDIPNQGELIQDNIYTISPNGLWGCQGMLVNNKNIDKIVDKLTLVDLEIDLKITAMGHKNELIVFVILPYLVNQGGAKTSTIRDLNLETFETQNNYEKAYRFE